ncbi:hypothetical protein BACCIP111899_01172 [Bacillus rhizoplanae]|uniref:SIR2-like domain-containing protein n=1 Tax=Bacillus rhizoplanae TaxID=2880966 RepID=A0ABM8Y8L4_9BACI|nr:hypothetical protein [Bacillus rhizoplanae]CAG9612000.1 hypothetical protein BACCIP111899_01172 [Bacillus rhizoplanae]
MDLNEAIKYILNGDGVLFLGAGFSREATNVMDGNMSDAQMFSDDLAKEMELGETDSLDVISDIYLQQSTSSEDLLQRKIHLIRLVQNAFSTKIVTDEQKEISILPWKRIYTTNYDDVVEFSNNYKIKSFTMYSPVKEILKEKCIVHLNGYVRTVSPERLDSEFKLTSRSYLMTDFIASKAKEAFDHDIKTAKVIVIIGTSLKYDIDIQRLLFNIPNIKEKTIFIERKNKELSVVERSKKQTFGEIYSIGLEGFSEKVREINNNFKPLREDMKFLSFSKVSTNFNLEYESIDENKMWQLLVNGDVDELLLYLYKDTDKYLIRRDVSKNIIESLDNKNVKIAIIHSFLGNGKTVLSKQLSYELTGKFNVYEFNGYEVNWELELEKISKEDVPTLIVIDDYQNSLDMIFKAINISRNNLKLLLTSRTSINISVYHRLEDKLPADNIIEEFDVNLLTHNEILKLCTYLKERNYTDIFGKKDEEIIRFLKQDCRSNLVNVLIAIIKSKNIQDKLNEVILPILNNQSFKDILITIIINNACQLNLKVDEIFLLLDSRLNIATLIRDKQLQEIISITDNTIRMKSSILSKYILNSNDLNSDVIKVVNKIAQNAEILNDEKCKNVRSKLISLSNIREIIVQTQRQSEKDINLKILSLYESLRGFKEYKGNIFFWLQYAMACIDTDYYGRAEEYFGNSYQLAKKANNFNTYQIDTQYGRYLLSKCIFSNSRTESFDVLQRVQALWLAAIRMRKERSDYVYRQFDLLYEFIEKFSGEWDSKQYKNTESLINYFIKVVLSSKARNSLKAIDTLEECKKTLLKNRLISIKK